MIKPIVIAALSLVYPYEKLPENRADEFERWRNLSFCLCAYEANGFTKEQRKNDGSVAAYFYLSHQGTEQLQKTETFIKAYLEESDTVYKSKNGSNLSLMKCIDLYNSQELKDHIKSTIR